MSVAFSGAKEKSQIRVIVKCQTDSDATLEACRKKLKGPGMQVIYDLEEIDYYVVLGDASEIDQLFKDTDLIQSVEDDPPRYVIKAQKNTDGSRRLTPDFASQIVPYGIDLIQARQAWEQFGVKGAGVKICVIDTGVAAEHEDLTAENLFGDSLYNNGGDPWSEDLVGHGTHVAGVMAAASNSIGVVGVAPNVEIVVIRIFDDAGKVSFASDLVEAASRCQALGAQVINMSLGGTVFSGPEFRAFEKLRQMGVVTVAAAGNDGNGNNFIEYPAGYDSVVSVTAIDANLEKADFNTFNQHVDIAAPGVNIWSTQPAGSSDCLLCADSKSYDPRGYGMLSGTSMASPHVAAVVALLFSYQPDASADHIINAITQSAIDLGESGRDDYFGHGMIDALAAMRYLNTTQVESQCNVNEMLMELHVITDWYGNETSWELVEGNTRRQRPGTTTEPAFLSGSNYEAGIQNEIEIRQCIPKDCYTFSILDSSGDGYVSLSKLCCFSLAPSKNMLTSTCFCHSAHIMCCRWGSGLYILTIDGQLVMTGSDFGKQDMAPFGICRETSMPTASPTKVEITVGTPTNPRVVVMPTEPPSMVFHDPESSGKEDRASPVPFGLPQIHLIAIISGGAFVITIIITFCLYQHLQRRRTVPKAPVMKKQQTCDTEGGADLK